MPIETGEVIDPHTAATRAANAQAIELEGQQKIWRWLVVGCFAALLLETLIAGKLTGTNRSSTVST